MESGEILGEVEGADDLLAHMDGQIRNIFRFAFYSGLRTSELIGLTWDKVDFLNRRVLVNEAYVDGSMQPLKTAGKGVVERSALLLDPALEALKAQKEHSFLEGSLVFHNPYRMKPWLHENQVRRIGWKPAFKKSGVRYRNPYQTRYTYAHIMIENNENIWWLANQMGHTGIEMINRHYGGWLEVAVDVYKPNKLFTAEILSEAENA